MLPFLAMAVGSPLGGWISDRWTRRSGPYAGRCGIAVIGMGLAAIFIAFGDTGCEPTRSEHRSCGWRGFIVSLSELILVIQRRSRQEFGRSGIRLHEHGWTDRRGGHRAGQPVDRRQPGLDVVVSCCGDPVCVRSAGLAAG